MREEWGRGEERRGGEGEKAGREVGVKGMVEGERGRRGCTGRGKSEGRWRGGG